ncbi:DUF4249 domain-containing protein [Mucilaginibacter daejeonensis]|uniref:DUF4249 domain-containing protein n=1 Tax=Mucilaginibacter daejeonensis TaxID=398049 RepID=UPI001D1756D9|nr:DUF4249 domain-containing protein [Mucilaginibacter daejeonensis]UEG51979.1 DUF4249 domain-containing protein [Mucilaginibacter daejeonensis]
MKTFINLIYLITAVVLFTSCEKVIDVQVNTSASQLVIEGNITNVRETQRIKVSRSVNYTETNNFPAVTGAKVVVKDNVGNTWNFTHAGLGVYTFGPVRGIAGRTYNMTVTTNDNNTYTASSTMPAQVMVDSLSFTTLTFGGRTRKHVAVHYTDPRGVANYYRYILYRNGIASKSIFVESDRLTDGNKIKDELFPAGADDEDDQELETGDEATVEAQCIDKYVFNFFFTLRQQKRGGPGGGVTPGNPPSNISNGALGYFSAHTYQAIKITVP